VGGGSRWEPLTEETAGDGTRKGNCGREGDWNVPSKETLSNMCCGAMLGGWLLKPGVPVLEIGELDRSEMTLWGCEILRIEGSTDAVSG
jgi:hypothetical protein